MARVGKQHWRERAEELRAVVETLSEEKNRRLLLEMAVQYDRVAETVGEDDLSAGSSSASG